MLSIYLMYNFYILFSKIIKKLTPNAVLLLEDRYHWATCPANKEKNVRELLSLGNKSKPILRRLCFAESKTEQGRLSWALSLQSNEVPSGMCLALTG